MADQEPAQSATKQKKDLPSAAGTFTEMVYNEEPATAAVDSQDQKFPESMDTVTEVIVDRKSHKHVMTPGEDLFKSLFATEKTPHNSPGSVASSGTLIDPSSRKVSPLDLGTLNKGSPTAVKDFAYPSPDSVCFDPLTMIEEETKKGLLKQLKKKTAAEEKASRKSEKLAARNKTLGAELKSTKATVKNRDAQADLAKVHANAMTVSNVVLRQIVKDLSQGLSCENDGTRAQVTASEGNTKWNQSKEESLRKHFRAVGQSSASAYGRMAGLENGSAVRGQDSNNTFSQESVQNANPSPIYEVLESKDPDSVAVQTLSRQTSEEAQTDVVGASYSTNTSEEAPPEATVEESKGRIKEKAQGFFERYGFNPAELSRILNSVTSTSQKASVKTETEEVTQKEALEEVEEQEVETMADEAVMTPLQEYQRQDLNLNEESAADQNQTTADPISTDFEDATPDQDESNESNGEDQVFETDEDTSPSTAINSGSDCNEDPAATEPTTNTIPSQDYANAIGSGHEGGLTESYEFSEPAGAATLWGILRSDQTENEANDSTADDTTADDTTDTGDDAASFTQAAGPATLWGILQSSQDENSARENHNTSEDTTGFTGAVGPTFQTSLRQHEENDNADAGGEANDTLEAAGPALLWGILRSEQAEEAEDQEDASEVAPISPEAVAPAVPCGDLRSEQDDDEVENRDFADDEAAGASDEEAPGPATLWGILKSEHKTSIDHPCKMEGSENGRVNGDEVLEDSASTDVAGAHDQDGTEPIDLAHDPPSPDSSENTNDVHDINDNEEEPSNPTGTPTVEENLIASPHGSVDDDDVAVLEVDTQEDVTEEAVVAIGANSPADTMDTVADAIEGSKVVAESEHKLEIETTELLHLHETTITVDSNTPVGAAEDLIEDAGDAIVFPKEDQGEQATEANASKVAATLGQLEFSAEKEVVQVVKNEAVPSNNLFQEATAEEKEGPKEGEMLDGSTPASNLQATWEEYEDTDNRNVANGSASTTTEGSDADSAAIPAQASSTPIYPRASPEFQVEEFDFNAPVPKAKRVKDPEKRKLERARAKAKVKEEKARVREEKALKRQMEEEAANTPEAVAQREAEEIKALGEKRLKLQEARGKKWSEARLPEV